MSGSARRIGLISDTHGLMRPEALDVLADSDLIVHAGDVGKPEIIEALQALAPVIVVKGNIDQGVWASALPSTAVIEAGAVRIYVVHNLRDLAVDPVAKGFHVIVSGHSHKPSREDLGGVLYINPGSAGPRRFQLPVTVARLDLGPAPWKIEIIDLLAEERWEGR